MSTVSSTLTLYEQFIQVQQIGFVALEPLYAMRRGGCLELSYKLIYIAPFSPEIQGSLTARLVS